MACTDTEYNKFLPILSATKNIINYLVENNEDLWKLLYYTESGILPLEQPNLTTAQKISMICTNPYILNDNVDKNILFQTTAIDEAFSTAIPQLRIEIGDIIPLDRVRGYMNINFQIVVPNRQDIFNASYNNVARRSIAIFQQLAQTLNGVEIEYSGFKSKLFMDRTSNAGKKTGSYPEQMSRQYTGRWAVFSVLI